MTELSKPETSIWRERLWFAARLFAAWAALVAIGDFVLLILSPIASDEMIKVGQIPNLWATTAVQALGAGWIYFITSYVIAGLFRENPMAFGAGVFAVGMIYNSLYGLIDIFVAPYVAERVMPGVLYETPWEYFLYFLTDGPIGHDLAYAAIVLLFAAAGATLRHFAPPQKIPVFVRRLRKWN